MAGLLAAEQAAVLAQRLEHVAVADRRRDHADAVLVEQPVEPEVRHHRHRDEVDVEVRARGSRRSGRRRRRRRSRRPRACGRRRRRTRRRGRAPCSVTVCCSARRSVAPQPTLMFVPSGSTPIAVDLGAELLERARRDLGVRAVRAVDADPQAARGRSRTARRCARGSCRSRRRRDRSSPPPVASASRSASISSSRVVVSFRPSPSKNLTPLYSGGLCDAVITAPRSSASSATPDVGSTPPRTAEPPADAMPRASACSSSTPEARVSRPTKTRPRPDQSATALPSFSTSSGVRISPTMPRTPSVPK